MVSGSGEVSLYHFWLAWSDASLGVRCGPVLQLPNFVNSVNGRGKNRWEATRVLEKHGPKTHLAVTLGAPLLAMIQHC